MADRVMAMLTSITLPARAAGDDGPQPRTVMAHRLSISNDPVDDALPFVVPPQRDGSKAQRPDPVIDLFESDVFPDEGTVEKERPPSPRDAADRRHASHFDMAGIFHWRQSRGHRAGCRAIQVRRRLVAQRLVRPLLVVFAHEPGEAALLRAQVGSRWPRRLRLQDRMELLVRA